MAKFPSCWPQSWDQLPAYEHVFASFPSVMPAGQLHAVTAQSQNAHSEGFDVARFTSVSMKHQGRFVRPNGEKGIHSECSMPRYLNGNMHGVLVLPTASQVALLKTHEWEQPAAAQSSDGGTLNSGRAQSSQQSPVSLIFTFALHLVHVCSVSVRASWMRSSFLSTKSLRVSVWDVFTMSTCFSMVRSMIFWRSVMVLLMFTIVFTPLSAAPTASSSSSMSSPLAPFGPGGPSTPGGPGSPGAPFGPGIPSTPASPGEPAAPRRPGAPSAPSAPGAPSFPGEPAGPGDPTLPWFPGGPGGPGGPDLPFAPSRPGGPGSPSAPRRPGSPFLPSLPGGPGGPGGPSSPGVPGSAASPGGPSSPAIPGFPGEPAAPEGPGAPSSPGGPA